MENNFNKVKESVLTITKAFEDGLISESLFEKAKKDLSKLVLKEILVHNKKTGKSFYKKVWVKINKGGNVLTSHKLEDGEHIKSIEKNVKESDRKHEHDQGDLQMWNDFLAKEGVSSKEPIMKELDKHLRGGSFGFTKIPTKTLQGWKKFIEDKKLDHGVGKEMLDSITETLHTTTTNEDGKIQLHDSHLSEDKYHSLSKTTYKVNVKDLKNLYNNLEKHLSYLDIPHALRQSVENSKGDTVEISHDDLSFWKKELAKKGISKNVVDSIDSMMSKPTHMEN